MPTSPPDPLPKELFLAALDLEPAAREPFLRRAANGDERLFARARGLLAAHDGADGAAFLRDDGSAPGRTNAAAAAELAPGASLGPYRLLSLLGEGGFGRVYLARQEEPLRRDVAIKVLRPGMDSAQVLARFQVERQALARMDHPGIARILDAGATSTGQPYFVMEYVDGLPVTTYCTARGLELEDRLRLFERICHAVHHAHQKGVIHRDLKPSNLLVAERDGEPHPKVIDFGIAKALEAPPDLDTALTGARQILGTPQYMSPEQGRAGGRDIDTRSDIYSLGAVLYELLTGTTPHGDRLRSVGYGGFLRVLEEEEPRRPSARVGEGGPATEAHAERMSLDPPSLSRALRDDLDWIVQKALEKEPGRRYESAAALARDLQRHLDHEPVAARRPAASYLLWKLVQRHQVAATAVAVAAVALVSGLVLAVLGLAEASRQRDAARAMLRETFVAEARASRATMTPGRRAASLEALRNAAAISASDDLRDEAIACLALADIRPHRERFVAPSAMLLGPRRHDLALRSADGELDVVDLATDATVLRLGSPGSPVSIAWFSPAGDRLALLHEDRSFAVLDLAASGAVVLRLPPGRFRWRGVAFDGSSDRSAWIAVAESTGRLHVYDLPSGSLRTTLPAPSGKVEIVGSPDGTALAVSSDAEEPLLVLWDLSTNSVRLRIPVPDGLNALDWSRDGRLLAGGADDSAVRVWRAEDGTLLRTMRGHQANVVAVAFDARGELLATGAWDNTVRLWWVDSGEPMLGPLRDHRLVGFDERLSTAHRAGMTLWDLDRGDELRSARCESVFGGDACTVAAHADGWLVTSGRNGLWVWTTSPLQPLVQLTRETTFGALVAAGGRTVVGATLGELLAFEVTGADPPSFGGARSVALFDGVRSCALGAHDGEVLVVDLQGVHRVDLGTGRTARGLQRYPGMTTPASQSPDGRWLFTGTWKGEPAALWDLAAGTAVARYAGPHVIGCFSPDGSLLCIGDRSEQRLLQTGTWRTLVTIPRDAGDDQAGAIAFRADGALVAVAHNRYVTRLVEVATGRVVASLEHPDGIAAGFFTFTGDGKRLAVVSPERALFVWDLERIDRGLRELGLGWQER